MGLCDGFSCYGSISNGPLLLNAYFFLNNYEQFYPDVGPM